MVRYEILSIQATYALPIYNLYCITLDNGESLELYIPPWLFSLKHSAKRADYKVFKKLEKAGKGGRRDPRTDGRVV